MARLISLTLERHPRLGACFVMRFSWNSRVENLVDRVKEIPAGDREYDPDTRHWWIAVRQVGVLPHLFENWHESAATLAAAQPEQLSAAMVEVFRGRLLETLQELLEAMPTITGDDLLAGLGEAVGGWLDEWRRAVPDAAVALNPASLRQVREAAAQTRADLSSWALRAAFVRELLSPRSPALPKRPFGH